MFLCSYVHILMYKNLHLICISRPFSYRRWGGTCNKNLGNAFLMVWRIGDENALAEYRGVGRRSSERSIGTTATGRRNSERSTGSADGDLPERPRTSHAARQPFKRGAIDLRRIPGLDSLSDKALVGFLKVIIEVNRDVQLLAYRTDKRLSTGSNTDESEKEGFKLRMGFGLHAGWA